MTVERKPEEGTIASSDTRIASRFFPPIASTLPFISSFIGSPFPRSRQLHPGPSLAGPTLASFAKGQVQAPLPTPEIAVAAVRALLRAAPSGFLPEASWSAPLRPHPSRENRTAPPARDTEPAAPVARA